MRSKCLFFLAALLFGPLANSDVDCKGKFPNPVSDVCWSCMYPITIGASPIMGQEQLDMDPPGPSSPLCWCMITTPVGVRVPAFGVEVGFFEPLRTVDVTRTPGCLVSMGTKLDFGLERPRAAQHRHDSTNINSFYQTNFYVNPILNWMEVVFDFVRCTDKVPLDIMYQSAFDPTHNDEAAAMILQPDAALFSNLVGQAACIPDCVATTFRMGISALYWCAGCQGSIYPLTGQAPAHQGGVMASTYHVAKLTAKLHRMLLTKSAYAMGDQIMSLEPNWCMDFPEPIMNKQQYKQQMVYPVPNTAQIGGSCCQPFGRTTVLWGAGKEIPEEGEDFAYLLFRKRNCCVIPYPI